LQWHAAPSPPQWAAHLSQTLSKYKKHTFIRHFLLCHWQQHT